MILPGSRRIPMLDELDRLQNNAHLFELLTHYARLGQEDRKAWHDRLMQVEGLDPSQLSKTHGELIAFDWIEQNSGQISIFKAGAVSSCYRVTLNGQRALAQLQGSRGDGVQLIDPDANEKAVLKFPKKKRKKSGA